MKSIYLPSQYYLVKRSFLERINFTEKRDKKLDCFNVLFLSRYKMEGNEASLQFTQLLEQVKRISELQNSGALEGVQDKERHLEHLQRQAEDIRNMLARLQVQPAPQSPTCQDVPPSEIYQNLGPLMGSGLRNSAAPALPPKSGKLSLFWWLLQRLATILLCQAFLSHSPAVM